jgi:hypothetical protein
VNIWVSHASRAGAGGQFAVSASWGERDCLAVLPPARSPARASALARTTSGSRGSGGKASSQGRSRRTLGRWIRICRTVSHLPGQPPIPWGRWRMGAPGGRGRPGHAGRAGFLDAGVTSPGRQAPAATDASLQARPIRESRHTCVLAIVLAFLRHPARSPALVAWLFGERYGFPPAWGVTRRCLPGGMPRRGNRSPEGATGPAGVAVSGDQAQVACAGDGLGAVGGAELAQDVGHVLFDRVERHEQVAGDALV